MKDRQSKLAKDLDRFVAHRRLLLTGTPLQNELRELWSLLNLLLPEVFDDKKGFTEWFGDVLGGGGAGGADEWLEKEKRVVVIHRLHQILEPFMLRRQVGVVVVCCGVVVGTTEFIDQSLTSIMRGSSTQHDRWKTWRASCRPSARWWSRRP